MYIENQKLTHKQLSDSLAKISRGQKTIGHSVNALVINENKRQVQDKEMKEDLKKISERSTWLDRMIIGFVFLSGLGAIFKLLWLI